MPITPRRFRSLGALALATGVLGGVLLPLATPATAVTTCEGTPGTSDFYEGPSASAVYDATFSAGPTIPDLPRYTPQGLVHWANWDGRGHSLLLLGTYWEGHRSRIYGINPSTGDRVGSFLISEAHLGGLAVARGFLFAQDTQGNRNGSVRKYRLSDVRKKLLASGTPYLSRYGADQRVYSAEFMTSYGDRVWSGHYSNAGPDKMYEYSVSSSGRLTPVGSSWKVPAKTQGVLVTRDRFVFSSSEGERGASRIWVVPRTKNFATSPGRCFRAPSMSEGIAAVGGTVFLAFEGGSSKYRDRARNVISKLHKAPLSELRSLTNPR